MAVAVAKQRTSIDQIFTIENSPTNNPAMNRTTRKTFKITHALNEGSENQHKSNKKALKLTKGKYQRSEILSPTPKNEVEVGILSLNVINGKNQAEMYKHRSDLDINHGADTIIGRASLNSSNEFKFFDRKDSLLAQASNVHRNSIISVASALRSSSQNI